MILSEGETITVFEKNTKDLLCTISKDDIVCRKDIDVIIGKE